MQITPNLEYGGDLELFGDNNSRLSPRGILLQMSSDLKSPNISKLLSPDPCQMVFQGNSDSDLKSPSNSRLTPPQKLEIVVDFRYEPTQNALLLPNLELFMEKMTLDWRLETYTEYQKVCHMGEVGKHSCNFRICIVQQFQNKSNLQLQCLETQCQKKVK